MLSRHCEPLLCPQRDDKNIQIQNDQKISTLSLEKQTRCFLRESREKEVGNEWAGLDIEKDEDWESKEERGARLFEGLANERSNQEFKVSLDLEI